MKVFKERLQKVCTIISICLSISDNRVVGEITKAVACSQENMTAEVVGRHLPEAYWDLKCLKKKNFKCYFWESQQ